MISNAIRNILYSSASPSASSAARWYNRAGNNEDPWISPVDHANAYDKCKIVYGENNFGSPHDCPVLNKGGA